MGNANKYADGLSLVLFPGNIAYGTAGYNFPESTAQDDGGGAGGNISLTFSGTSIPFSTNNPVGYYRGASGYAARYTPLAMMTGGVQQRFYDRGPTIAGSTFTGNVFGAPDLRSIFGVSNRAATEAGTAPQDNGTFVTERLKNSRAFNSISQVNILDLICEGPIEGFVSGIYIPNLSGKTTGDIGYTSVTFQPYEQTYSNPETRSIFWDDVPITDLQGYFNFQFADYKYTYGEKTNDHTIYNPYLNLYEDRRDYFGRQVDRNKIPLQTSITKSIGDTLYGFYLISGNNQVISPKTYYIYNTDISSIRINFKINSLFEQILTGTNAGDVEKQLQTFRIIISRLLKNGETVLLDTSKYSPYTKDYYSRDEFGAQGKISNSPVIVPYEITLRPYAENSPWFELFPNQIGWAIDVVKMSREGVGGGLSTSTTVDSITEVYSDRFVYPDAALVFSKFDARYFNQIPTRTYKVRLLKVKIPVNYDPITRNYNGSWNGKFKVAWTDNPAWCFYDLITNNRFGLGKYIDSSLTDKWTLYEIAQYCDELVSDGTGGLEPRFRCNVYIANKEEAYKVLNDMASIFRAIVYYSAGQITISQDSLKQPIYLFNNSNVIEGTFNYSDASKKSRKTVASVRFNDENDNFKPAIEYIEDKDSIIKYGIRETDIIAFGCTNKNQARRVGKWLLTTQNTETELVDFQVGLEGHYIRPGDVILIHDQYRKNATYAGRTVELTTGYAILDLPYNSTNTYAITGVNANNSFVFNVLTPTYNLNLGTTLGDLYSTGFVDITSSGVTGLNSSFFRRGQLQSITINNPQNYLTSGSGIYANNIRINFPSRLSNSGYSLPQNTVWAIDINPSGYLAAGIDTKSPINNPSNALYPGYYLEPYLNEPKKYRVLTISEKEPELFNINALEYNDKKYYDIDNTATLVNVPVRPNLPVAPSLFLSGIFRSPTTNSYISGPNGAHFTTNQGGINSIMYNIQPPNNNASNSLYYVYVKPTSNFTSATTPEIYLTDVISPQLIRTGLTPFNWSSNLIPPFLTPTGSGFYYFRVFAENALGERSSPTTGLYTLQAQASVFSVLASGYNIY